MNTKTHLTALFCVLVGLSPTVSYAQSGIAAATLQELVAAYDSLADTILAASKTEQKLVLSVLATTYTHARATLGAARTKLQSGQAARSDIEKLAALVSQLGNEGDAAVAAIRKRLVEGGHHHHAGGEQQGIYDEGFVVVTRAAKKVFLDAATEIGKLSGTTDANALDAQWQIVETEFDALMRSEEEKSG